MDTQYMKAYTIKEVSKMLNVPPGTLRQWEKDLNGLLLIPRSKQGARFYTDHEIALLEKVKQMRDKNLSKEMIRELMQKHMDLAPGMASPENENALATVEQETAIHKEPDPVMDAEQFMVLMENFRDSLLTDIRNEIRSGVRKEVMEEVKKRLAKGHCIPLKAFRIQSTNQAKKQKRKSNHCQRGLSRIRKKLLKHSELFRRGLRKVRNALPIKFII